MTKRIPHGLPKPKTTKITKAPTASRAKTTAAPIHNRALITPAGPSLLRMHATEAKVGFKKSQIYKWIAAGTFPPPKRVGGTAVSVWLSSDLDNWIAEQVGEVA